MGNHVSLNTNRGTTLVRRPASNRGRQLLKEGGNFPLSRLTNSGTPRNFEHDVGNSTGFLVACHEKGRNRVHQRLRQLSSREKSTKQTKTPSVSYRLRYVFHTIRVHSHGLHCQTTPFELLRYNTYYHRHFLKSVHFHTVQ